MGEVCLGATASFALDLRPAVFLYKYAISLDENFLTLVK
jgi:hypothetical protein